MRFTPPADGLPCVRDWIVCWESMLHGIDLGREPLSCNVASSFIDLLNLTSFWCISNHSWPWFHNGLLIAKATFPADGLDLIFQSQEHCFDLSMDFFGWIYPHHKSNEWGDKLQLETCSLDIVKGWTKASVIAFVLLAAAEYDVEEHWSKLEPLVPFLDRAFLLPTYDSHITLVLFSSTLYFWSNSPNNGK